MRICLVSSSLLPVPTATHGAVELQMEAHARGLAALGHEVHVLTVGEPTGGDDGVVSYHRLGPAFERSGGSGTVAGLVASQVGFARRARARCRELDPDVVHWHARYPCVLGTTGARRGERWARVYHAHNWKVAEGMRYPRTSARHLAARVGARLDARIARRCDLVLAVSEFVRGHVLRTPGVPAERAGVLTNVVDPARFAPAPDAGAASPSAGPPEVLFVGRIAAEKGLDTLIEAWPAVLREVPEAVLRVVGPTHGGTERGAYPRRCEELVARLGLADRVRFHGEVPNARLPERLHAARALAVPSVWGEPCGVVVLEGLAAGLPVVASRVGGIPELIDEGENGRLCPPGDARAWAEVLVATLRDEELRQRSRRAGPAAIAARHTWERVGPRLAAAYEHALERRPPAPARAVALAEDGANGRAMAATAVSATPAAPTVDGGGEAAAAAPAPRIKILFVLTSSAGGAGEQAYQLAREIDRERFDLTVAFGPGYPLDADFARLELPVVHLSMSRRISPLVNLRGMLQLRRMIRRERYDLVCTSCSVAGFHGRIAARLAGTGARTVHVIQVYASRDHQPPARQAFYRFVERRLDALTDRYVAVSGAVKRFGVDHELMRPEKVEVIYNAAELPPVEPSARARVRAELDLDPRAPVVGTLGRYEEQKGLAHFLRAAARIRAARDDVQFLVVGDGPLRDRLEALAVELDIAPHVRFTGWRRDVPEVLQAMDAFCLASLWETFGIVLAEAMLAELPVVASRVDGIPEVVAEDETGFLVAARDEAALAERLLRLIDDPELARRMGRAGCARAKAEFSVPAMVAAYEDFFWRTVSG